MRAGVTQGGAGQRGFTLVELLVAMLLLSLLGVVLGGAFHLATRHVDRQGDRLDRAAELQTAFHFLRDRLEGAVPALPLGFADGAVLFEGRRDGLDFVGAAPQSLPGGGLQLYSLAWGPQGLMLRWQPYEGMIPQPGGPRSDRVLLPGVGSAAFAYFGDVEGGAPRWRDDWRDAPSLPALVRLRLTGPDGTPLPDMVFAPRAAD